MKTEDKKTSKTTKTSKRYEIKEPSESLKVEEPATGYLSPPIDYENKLYTYADYLTWLDDKRREIINGIVRLMAGPNYWHARLCRDIFGPIYKYLERRKGDCEAFIAPFDVRLPKKPEDIEDNKIDTVVQPDIFVVCDPSKIDSRGCLGAPDLVIEILSPSNCKYDFNDKFNKYEFAGVKEYWVVSPFTKGISVFILQPNGKYCPEIFYEYKNDEFVPVRTLPGLKIKLNDLFEE